MRLFMQAGGATVELPNTSSADSVFTVSETVGFRDSVVVDNPVSSVDSLEEDIWKSIDMDRIDIVAQRKSIERILERNGEVTLMFYEENGKSEEELIRALMLSHLTVIYIKQSLGRLSALCGCVVAATGSSCGITWLMGGTYEQVAYAVQNMIANLTGMICDGAKPSCALKVTTGVSTAVLSAIMAMENRCVTSVEGIIDEDVDQSIRNLTKIGSKGMNETDKLVLEIMTSK